MKDLGIIVIDVDGRIWPGHSKSLWAAVKIAKGLNIPKLPETMFFNNIKVPKQDLPDIFADYFISRVKIIVDEQTVSNTVYNGVRKINCHEFNSMME